MKHAGERSFIERPLLTCFAEALPLLEHTTGRHGHLQSHAPELNTVEGIWSLLLRRSKANTAFTEPDHRVRVLRHGLCHV